MKRIVSILLFAAATSGAALAEPACTPTPHLNTARYPGAAAIAPNNNLLLPTGKSVESSGQKLVIHGQVLDKSCIPVPNAVVEIWHLNPFGTSRLADGKELATPYPTFAGAGRTVTDNDGEFVFTTAFPGTNKSTRAPQVNIRVSGPDMKDYTTVLYFENDRRNVADPAYKRLSLERRASLTMQVLPEDDMLNANARIILPAYAPYRTY